MAEVALDRADQQGCAPAAAAAEHRAERARLDRVAEQGSGAVGLDVVDVRRIDPGRAIRAAQEVLLGLDVRRGDPVRAAVLVDGGPAQDGEDAVAVAACVGEPLEHDDAGALGADDAVGGGRERLAAAGSARSLPIWWKAAVTAGPSRRFAPAAIARSLSPARRLCMARWTATSDDEQAVSTATLGPRRSSA